MLGAIGMEMSDGGDIWSTGIFSYESPLKDLLDSGNFTLEDLLAEDELLQELRSNEPLVAFFGCKDVVRKLLEFVISKEPPSQEEEMPPLAQSELPVMNGEASVPSKVPGAWLMEHIEQVKAGKTDKTKKLDPTFRKIRFPYMACEVICSELPNVLDLLAEPELLDVLWSLVTDSPTPLDDYRAGYFDKITNVLFRRKPDEISNYINGTMEHTKYSKTQLMEALIRHLSSHSIMQITQQLLMPARPKPDETPMDEQGDEIVSGDEDENVDKQVRCEWVDQPQILQLLLDTLLSNDVTMALNASEVLTAVVQNSMLSSPIVLSLCSDATIQRLVDAAIAPETFSRHESRNTIAMNVLENIVLQLGGYGSVGTMTLVDNEEEVTEDIADLTAILAHLHRLLDGFSNLLTHEKTKEWTSPTQFSKDVPQQLLGTSRLRIVRTVEALILLGDPSVDRIIVQQSRCLECCLNFFWEFQWCSMLHQSVANLLVHVFEGQNIRAEMQEFLLVKCNLMERLMESFSAHDPDSDGPPPQTFRYGYMGHVIIICQALVHAYSPGDDDDDVPLNDYGESSPNPQSPEDGQLIQPSATAELIPPDSTIEEGVAAEAITTQTVDTPDQSTDDGIPRDDFGEPLVLFELVFNHTVAARWLEFVETVLATDNAMQVTPLGGFPVQAPSMMQRPGLVDEGFMMGDDGDGPPAPPTRLSEVLEMDDNDLDVAVSMMDEFNIREDGSNGSGSSGDTATEQRAPYVFDDPLGKAGTLGLELNTLQKLKNQLSSSSSGEEKNDDSDNGSSSDEEPETPTPEVPVMDLFAGNFNYEGESTPTAPVDDFADFADFDTMGRGGGPDTDNDFGPFASAEEKSKLDEIFGEGDHADLLENDDDETPPSSKAEDPFKSVDDAIETANRIFDEGETIASLADKSRQNSPLMEEKDRVSVSLVADTAIPAPETLWGQEAIDTARASGILGEEDAEAHQEETHLAAAPSIVLAGLAVTDDTSMDNSEQDQTEDTIEPVEGSDQTVVQEAITFMDAETKQ